MADKGNSGRIGVTIAGAVVSVPASYVLQRALGAWGVLDAFSDALGKWLKIHVPAATAGWTIALLLVLAVYALLLWKVWRPRHIHHGDLRASATPIPSLEMEVARAGISHAEGSEAFRKNEPASKRQRAQELADRHGAPSPVPSWIGLDDALRYIANDSDWGQAQDHTHPNFSIHVGVQMQDRLACGDLKARGRDYHTLLGGAPTPPMNPLKPISQDFWADARIEAYWPLKGEKMRVGTNLVEHCVRRDGNEGVYDVQVEEDLVRAIWPPAQPLKRPRFPPMHSEQFPARHKEILNSLADVLAEVQNLSLAKAYWNSQTHHSLRQDHLTKLAEARTRAENLNEQIPYDPETMHTVRDFLQATNIVVHDGLQGWDDRESRSDLARIASGLFRYLHDGKAVDRRKIDLPDWCRAGDYAAPIQQRTEQQDRREIIANGRDIVQQYCDQGMPIPFAEYLAKQRAYLDIKPHIGDAYWQRRFKRERPDTPEQRDLDQADFQAELARLEKEWGL